MRKTVIVSIALLASLGLHGNAEAITEISYNDFSSSSDYTLLGSAQKVGSTLQLVPNTANVVGGVFFSTPVDASSFSASFSFTFSNPGGGDGMVFVIKNPESSGSYKKTGLGYTGEAIAYGDRYGVPGIRNSVGVEFDSHKNNTADVTNDINDNHIGIDTNASMLSLAQVPVTLDFNSANPWYAWVDYDGTTLSVSVNQTGTQPDKPMLSYGTSENPFVISDYTGSSTALVGFTASTGGAYQTTTLNSFSFDSTPVPEPSTLALLGTGAVFAGIASRRKARKTSLAG
ncbi:PEP-CTERM sorting domain-containing protein [Chlorobaculum thiosulfatiphilum]|uniref:PEP-CTERM sorting domain-containing protein n=1 Tax=Chlorobaculum thiosulfatiphilum TaxID=115852 RepID=A0A5C4S7L3_CHLTI|nr:PEP-CTERM sorting domain-containing protein [Chlorobaculum thiosulfatiphilum]TNJ39222.1 PEP-CTERM sorting domain-containing protein [Chlorobaculum thiosulfatiphilum]